MKVLLYGANGWIGQQFGMVLDNANVEWVTGTSRCDSDPVVQTELDIVNPTHVVSMIGRTHGTIGDKQFPTIDYLEQSGKLSENLRDNLLAPITLAQHCTVRNIHFTYLGTGCIFEYDNAHTQEGVGFTETDRPNFTGSGYSTAKGVTDQLMAHLFGTTALNLRIRMPITATTHPRNFITKITTYDNICSMPNSMSVLPTLLPALVDLMRDGTTGTLNFTNPGVISHNEILEMYRELVDPTFQWANFSLEDQDKILDSGRSNNRLDTTRLEGLCPGVPTIREAVRALFTLVPSTMHSAN